MTGHAAEEPRLRQARGHWDLKSAGLSGRVLAGAGALLACLLLGTALIMRRGEPLPRRRMDFPAPPQLNAQIASAQEKLRANPQDITALVELGTLLFEKGKDAYVDAIGDLEQARDLGALDPRIFYCLGIMYQEEGLYPFALTEYQRFLRLYPADKEIRLLAAKLEYRMGVFRDAIADYERLKYANPSDPIIEENLGLSLWGAKLTDRAQGSFGQLKTYGGDFARRAEFYLGQIALEDGRFAEAADHFSKCAPSAGPLPGIPDERVWTGLAMASQKLGRDDQAKAAWEAVLKTSPKDRKARAALRVVSRRLAAAERKARKAQKDKK